MKGDSIGELFFCIERKLRKGSSVAKCVLVQTMYLYKMCFGMFYNILL